MNRIHRKVWNSTLDSAGAPSQGTSGTLRRRLPVLAVCALLFGGLPALAMAQAVEVGGNKTCLTLSSSLLAKCAVAGNARATGTNAVAIGARSVASGNRAVALGAFAEAAGESSTAVGDGAYAAQIGSTATGGGASAEGAYSTATGYESVASGLQATASGFRSERVWQHGAGLQRRSGL